MTTVTVHNGTWRNQTVKNVNFNLVYGLREGQTGPYITVEPGDYFGPNVPRNIRIKIDSISDFEITNPTDEHFPTKAVESITETDDEVMMRIEQRFEILDEMTKASINGDVRAMIVVGPPGVGKSYGVETQLEKSSMFDRVTNKKIKYEVVKGAMSALGLYATMFKFSDANNVLVFDDCDSILFDDTSLNLLKAALDSGKKRKIHWNSDSHMLRREGIPDSFEFKGSIIFITNINFDNIKSKKLQDHIGALHSRCHYLDLTMNTMRDKFLRIKQIFRKGDLFKDYDFTPEEGDEILEFMDENKHKLREMSLRMALKIADLTNVSKNNWRNLAITTCMRPNDA
jgi:hypothetical protein